jgi:hypothetical protein
MNNSIQNQQGAVMLLVVLLLSSAFLIMSVTASRLGLGDLLFGHTSQKGQSALHIADGCVEEVLERIRKNLAFGIGVGEFTLLLSDASCTINIVKNGNGRTVTVLASVEDFYKKIKVEISVVSGNVALLSWRESPD